MPQTPLASLKLLWAHHKPTMILLATAVVVAFFFAAQFALDHHHWRGRPAQPPALEPWMTVRFVAHAYHVPPEVVGDALGLSGPAHRASLQDIAGAQGRDIGDLLVELEQQLIEAAPPPPAVAPPEPDPPEPAPVQK